MTSRPDRTCRNVRRELVAALLEAPGLDQLPGSLAGHLGACRDCAAYRQRLLEAASSFPPEGAYRPRLRARTLAAVERDRERGPASFWMWFTPAAPVIMVAAYGVPAWALSRVLGAVIGSPGLVTVAAALIVGSLLALLPASLAVSLVRCAPKPNSHLLFDEKGTPS